MRSIRGSMRWTQMLAVSLLVVLAASLAPSVRAGSNADFDVQFEYPAAAGYAAAGRLTIRWVPPELHPGAPRFLLQESGPIDRNGGCANASYEPGDIWSVETNEYRAPGHQAGTCYRYRLMIEPPGKDPLISSPSAALRIVSKWTGRHNVYRAGTFATQKTWTWCVGASVQMMRNIILDRTGTGRSGQQKYMKWARAHDRLPNTRSPGSDPKGWARALREYTGVTAYWWRGHGSYMASLRQAAARLRKTDRPVGLLVSRGGHAWVMTGFEATADPALTSDFTVTHVFVSGPLYPKQQRNGYDQPPNTRLSADALRTYFVRFRGVPADNSMVWDQLFVTITA